ncbi:MAG: hypothetical protein AAB518_02005 [Patescibacteria group bacterium]
MHLVRVSWNRIIDSLKEIVALRDAASSSSPDQDTKPTEDGKDVNVAA